MYAFIEGIIEQKSQSELVINTNGVGYLLLCSNSTLSSAPPRGEFMRVYTYLSVRQDAMDLFGFVSVDEKNMCLQLNSISGIAPKTALGILAALPLGELTMAILTGDAVMLSRAPGIGKKTAQRIVLELKDKFTAEDLAGGENLSAIPHVAHDSVMAEAIMALQSLGYTQTEAARAVSAVQQSGSEVLSPDEIVRSALRSMSKG